jgi:hypothetical protein
MTLNLDCKSVFRRVGAHVSSHLYDVFVINKMHPMYINIPAFASNIRLHAYMPTRLHAYTLTHTMSLDFDPSSMDTQWQLFAEAMAYGCTPPETPTLLPTELSEWSSAEFVTGQHGLPV